MFEKIKNFFGIDCDQSRYDELADAERTTVADKDLEKRYESLKKLHESLLLEHENLSKKYFALKLSSPNRYPSMKDEFAPKCVRKEQELCSFFRMRDHDSIPAFKKFLRRSGHWTLEEDPDVRRGHVAEGGEPCAWFENEKFVKVEIPYGWVFLVFGGSPRTEWLVITEERFDKDWLVVG